jgi:hypothetical protein
MCRTDVIPWWPRGQGCVRAAVCLFVAAVGLAFAPDATAAKSAVPRVMVWPVGEAAVPDELRQGVFDVVAKSAAALRGWRLQKPDRKQKAALAKAAKACAAPDAADCIRRVSAAVRADLVMVAIARVDRDGVKLTLRLVSAAGVPLYENDSVVRDLAALRQAVQRTMASPELRRAREAPARSSAGDAQDGLALAELPKPGAAKDDEPALEPLQSEPALESLPGAGDELSLEPLPSPAKGPALALLPGALGEAVPASASADDLALEPLPGGAAGDALALEPLPAGAVAGDELALEPLTPAGEAPKDTATAVSLQTTAEEPAIDKASSDDKPVVGFGVHVDLLVPTAGTGGPAFGVDLSPSAGIAPTLALLAEVRVYLPFAPLRDLGLSLEVGWYQIGQGGERKNPADPDFGDFRYSATVQAVPILVGPVYRLPWQVWLLEFHVGAGFALEWVWATTSYEVTARAIQNATQQDLGVGFYAGAEAAIKLGPGLLNAAYRFLGVYTDLGLKDVPAYQGLYNRQDGATAGHSVLLGYRLVF